MRDREPTAVAFALLPIYLSLLAAGKCSPLPLEYSLIR